MPCEGIAGRLLGHSFHEIVENTPPAQPMDLNGYLDKVGPLTFDDQEHILSLVGLYAIERHVGLYCARCGMRVDLNGGAA
jgi:hypothetical protein